MLAEAVEAVFSSTTAASLWKTFSPGTAFGVGAEAAGRVPMGWTKEKEWGGSGGAETAWGAGFTG